MGKPQHDMIRGTLDMLILRTLQLGPVHGHGIATSIEMSSDDEIFKGTLLCTGGEVVHPMVKRIAGTEDNNPSGGPVLS